MYTLTSLQYYNMMPGVHITLSILKGLACHLPETHVLWAPLKQHVQVKRSRYKQVES